MCCSTPAAPNKPDDSVQFLVYWVHAMSARIKQHKTHGLATQNLEAGLQVRSHMYAASCVTQHDWYRYMESLWYAMFAI